MQTLKELTYIDIPLRRDHLNDKALYRLMGYGNRVPDNAVLEIIESLTIKLMQACKARAGYRIVECKHNDSSNIVCDGTIFHTGNIIASAMERATMLAIFTVTLGKAYKEWMEEIRGEADIVREFVGDSIASVFTDGVTEELISILRAKCAAEGLRITNNYSPGYCNWQLEEQRLLFSLLPEGVSGITLTESFVMLPTKSVSGIIGIGKDVTRKPYGCAVCTMRERCHAKR